MSSRRAPRSGRLASFFFLLGCTTVLAAAFALGVAAGRHWPGLLRSLGPASAARPDEAGRGGARGAERTTGPEPVPPLTFYRELTAPLGPAAAGSETARPARERVRPARAAGTPRAAAPEAGTAPDPARREEDAAPAAAGRFTVQVAAFSGRPQAEALRAGLAAAGYPAYVTEREGGGARWRVRVGSFTSRDEARQLAERLGAERRLSPYVAVQ